LLVALYLQVRKNIKKLEYNMLNAYITPSPLKFFLVYKSFGMLL